jgi:multicomponent Na+:H+ antiporter subunit G
VTVLEWCGAVAMLLGGLLSLSAAVGIVVLPDVAARLQAATKPQVAGLLLVVVGAAPFLTTWSALSLLALVALFQLVTAPVLAQLLARAAYRSGSLRHDQLVIDELHPSERADPPPGQPS